MSVFYYSAGLGNVTYFFCITLTQKLFVKHIVVFPAPVTEVLAYGFLT